MGVRGGGSGRRILVATVAWAAVAGCASSVQPPPLRTAHAVSAVVIANRCVSLGAANAKLAEKAMNQLVDGCGSFAGGSARFTASLLPGGAIQFEATGAPADTIPMCVVSHPLTHSVHLTKPCALDVVLEESSMALPNARDGGPG